jgi:uncharacterized protein
MAGGTGGVNRRQALQALAGLGVGAFTGAGAWGYFYERQQLEVVRATLHVHALPPALIGLRIALLTDIHRSDSVPEEFVRRAVQAVRAARPDLVILGGDYVTLGDRKFVEPAGEALSGLEAPNGVYGILGNHDDDRDMPAALARRGVAVLKDARTSIEIRGQTVDLVGLRFWTRKGADVQRIVRGTRGFPILLAHDPRRLSDAAALEIPLVLSGHTHGGQIVIPGLSAMLARKFPILAGKGRKGVSTIYVSRGIGTVYVPVRLNCPPEVSVLTLVAASSA